MDSRALRMASASCALLACLAVPATTARGDSSPAPQVPPAPAAVAAPPDYSGGPISSTDADATLTQFLSANVTPIDLFSAFRLVGEQNPQVLIAQERVIEALALRQLAAAQFLPTLN